MNTFLLLISTFYSVLKLIIPTMELVVLILWGGFFESPDATVFLFHLEDMFYERKRIVAA